MNTVLISHMVEPAEGRTPRRSATFREVYWESGKEPGKVLRVSPLDEFPVVAPRWEVYGSDTYGSSPCMDALPDVRQLQQMVKRKAQGLDKLVNPAMLVNRNLASKPKIFTPGGTTYVAGGELLEGARPLHVPQIPFQELRGDIQELQLAVRHVLFNDLFRMISDLDTVRSATEIDARREERLIQLGPVLERFEAEGLGPIINRIFQICLRAGVFLPPPEGLDTVDIQVEYVGILADAQRAVGTVSIERFLQVVGNLAGLYPDAVRVPNIENMLRRYAEMVGLKAADLNSREEVQAGREAEAEQQSMMEAAQMGQGLVQGAQQLSSTDLGGGQNALQALLGG